MKLNIVMNMKLNMRVSTNVIIRCLWPLGLEEIFCTKAVIEATEKILPNNLNSM